MDTPTCKDCKTNKEIYYCCDDCDKRYCEDCYSQNSEQCSTCGCSWCLECKDWQYGKSKAGYYYCICSNDCCDDDCCDDDLKEQCPDKNCYRKCKKHFEEYSH